MSWQQLKLLVLGIKEFSGIAQQPHFLEDGCYIIHILYANNFAQHNAGGDFVEH